ncbi:hypothetical protein BS47DRAFT_1198919 [Hydnum rufescens UP504]|uniref:ATP synthase F0 subunit 8 n=1 Tax=Hydnum rufescens UP504 TaxID=1448309 RepID=A0A9P6AUQ4_9AGAM|nr:hypothetical protein BS47DRAFT_1198919 [Hydnum rufescens UP504]
MTHLCSLCSSFLLLLGLCLACASLFFLCVRVLWRHNDVSCVTLTLPNRVTAVAAPKHEATIFPIFLFHL